MGLMLNVLEGADVAVEDAIATYRRLERAISSWRFSESPTELLAEADRKAADARPRLARAATRLPAEVRRLERRLGRKRQSVEAAAARSAQRVALDPNMALPELLDELYTTPAPTRPPGAVPPRVFGAMVWLLFALAGGLWSLLAITLGFCMVATAFIDRVAVRRSLTALLAVPLVAGPLWVFVAFATFHDC
jgi:hypothetical protein